MGFRGIRLGGVAVLLDVDDTAPWKRQTPRWRVSAGTGASHAVRHGNTPALRVAKGRTAGADAEAMKARIAAHDWYHTIDLGDGIVTPGALDHRAVLDHVPLPDRLDGLRVLDVATFDGFWAFELERRGAAEVVAIDLAAFGDIDLPVRARAGSSPNRLSQKLGAGFSIAREALGSRVRKEVLSVYDLSPERLGTFDLVFCGDLLLHLQNPIRALERMRSVTGGRALFVESFHPMLPHKTVRYNGGAETCIWWYFSRGALHQMIADAGFDDVQQLGTFKMRFRTGEPLWQVVFGAGQ